MIYKLYRKTFDLNRKLCSIIRMIHLRIKYPSINITGKTYIGRNCEIICVDGGDLRLNNAVINYGCFIHCGKDAKLYIDSAYIGMNSVVAAQKSIIIKPNCEIAEMVTIRDQDHVHDLSDTPIKDQGLNCKEIIINENVWIGAKSTVLKGVEISVNSVVGANSVVTKSIVKTAVVVGVPAKEINKIL